MGHFQSERVGQFQSDKIGQAKSESIDQCDRILHHRVEASRKWGIFRDLLGKIENDSITEFLKANKTYGDEVINVRNKFAHAKAETDGAGKMLLKGQFGQEGFEFDTEACIDIRKKLINHKKNIEKLKKSFTQ